MSESACRMRIGDRLVGTGLPTFIIAEVGMNHNGDLDLAKELIMAAGTTGVDAVKFQTFKTELYFDRSFPDYDVRVKHELPYEWHSELYAIAHELGLEFFSTPFDEESVDFLNALGVPCFKIASSDCNNFPFIRYVARKQKPILLSTGYSHLAQVQGAVETICEEGNEQIVILHCVASYPLEPEDLNMQAMETLRCAFNRLVGFSDHSQDSLLAPIMATTLGGCVYERHFTIDRTLPGYDHGMSATPEDMARVVRTIRSAEAAMGDGLKRPTQAEHVRLAGARRSLHWKGDYEKGTPITEDMFLTLRPGDGIRTDWVGTLVGKSLRRNVTARARVRFEDLDLEQFTA